MDSVYFQKLIASLDQAGHLSAAAKQAQMPEASKTLSKLIELGVAPDALTRALAEVFPFEVYSADEHGEFQTLDNNCKWGIAKQIFFTANPFDRGLLPGAVLDSRQSTDLVGIGLMPVNISNTDAGHYEDYAAAEKQIRSWIIKGYEMGASDIHVAPLSTNYVRVRTRVDGQLRRIDEVPTYSDNVEVSYRYISNMLMRLAGLETGAFIRPADGSFEVRLSAEVIEVRMNMRPVTIQRKPSQAFYLRLFGNYASRQLTRVSDLGLTPEAENKLAELRRLNQNLILVTGPTGSGKSTTLYANLREILYETPGRSIQTLEDPVECYIDGIEQTEINERAGMSFEAGLRGLMRSDVDVILVGEVRDSETAKLAVRASLTGHLVFATVHTKSALAAVERFVDFGVSRKMLAAVLGGVFAQRLVRKLCSACRAKKPYCGRCESGYRGRHPISEVIRINDELRSAIAHERNFRELEQLARANGNTTLWDCADALIESGVTTLAECQLQLPPSDGERQSTGFQPTV